MESHFVLTQKPKHELYIYNSASHLPRSKQMLLYSHDEADELQHEHESTTSNERDPPPENSIKMQQ